MSRATQIACCALAASLLGCQRRNDDCTALLDAMRPPLARIEKLHGDAPGNESPSIEALRATGAAYTDLAESVSRVAIFDDDMQRIVSGYKFMAADITRAYQSMATAIEKDDKAALQAATETLDRVHSIEWATLDRITVLCGER